MHDTILTQGNIIDVRSRRIYESDVCIKDGIITRIEPSCSENAKQVIDVSGKFISPGFIDSHLHIESSMLSPLEFSKEAVKHGTTSLFVDPHEIANVCGRKGIDLFLKQAEIVPLDIYVGIPSCVPATELEDSGASITLQDIKELIPDRRIFGLAEMMNFPGIIHDIGDAREKVDLAYNAGKIVDGHCPGLTGPDLMTYITNGKNDNTVRIMSDHESIHLDEVIEKNRAGMTIALRYGSATKDLERLLPGLLEAQVDLERFMLCSDDLDPIDLLENGHVDRIIKKTRGIILENTNLDLEQAVILAIALATINPSRYFSRFLKLYEYPETGEIAEGKKANLVVLETLEDLDVTTVIHDGRLVISDKEYIGQQPDFDYSEFLGQINTGKKFQSDDFKITPSEGPTSLDVKVIEVIEDSLVTELNLMPFAVTRGELQSDPGKDVVKIAVIERHRGIGSFSLGFVKGLGIKKGAIASTVAHDSHNLIVAGSNNESMARAANLLSEKGGGMAVVADRIDYFPLEIAGLMSTSKIEKVVNGYTNIKKAAKRLGSPLENAFMTLSFLALPVIPKLKITNRGLVDVDKFQFVDLY
ncbi:MAG: adenine deaminase [Candidatus Aminicenantes bacterium]|jgi:adenine deaminase